MSETSFVYFTDAESGSVRRRHRDGAAFVAYGQPHALGFWARHRDIERFEDGDAGSQAEAGDVAVRVWLRSTRIEDNTDWPAPEGDPSEPPDLEFSGAGRMGDAFWLSHPDVAEVRVFNHLGDDSMEQDCWLVKVWLKDS
jgi:hypothetical protein